MNVHIPDVNNTHDTPELREKWVRFIKNTAVAYLMAAAKIQEVEHLFDAHIIQFQDGRWIIRHPIRERVQGTLFDCVVHRFDYDGSNVDNGYYWINETDGSLKAVVDEEDIRKLI